MYFIMVLYKFGIIKLATSYRVLCASEKAKECPNMIISKGLLVGLEFHIMVVNVDGLEYRKNSFVVILAFYYSLFEFFYRI